jgi:hypothetical protein
MRRIFLLFVCVVLFQSGALAEAASTGLVLPSSAQSISDSPWSNDAWTDQNNIFGAGEASVTASTFDNADRTYVLKAYNFNFSSIPSNAVITGIRVVVNCRRANGTANLALVQLLDASRAKFGNNKTFDENEIPIPTTAADYEFGGDGDKWGVLINRALTQDTDFGVGIGFLATGNDADVFVDSVRMEVFYAVPDADPAWSTVTDDFNRSNGTLGANWGIFNYSDPNYLVINSNQVTGNSAGAYNGSMYVGTEFTDSQFSRFAYITGDRFFLAVGIRNAVEVETLDDFNRADANPISDGPASDWENYHNGFRIISNQAAGITANDWNVAFNMVPLSSIDQVADVQIPVSGHGVEIALRLNEDGDGYVLHVEPGTSGALIYRVFDDQETWELVQGVSGVGYSAGSWVTFMVTGTNPVHLRAFIDGTQVLYAVDSAPQRIVAGDYSYMACYSTTTRLDNFSASSMGNNGGFYHLLYDHSDQRFTLRGTADFASVNWVLGEYNHTLSSNDNVTLKRVGNFLKVDVNDTPLFAEAIPDGVWATGGSVGAASYGTDIRLDNFVGGFEGEPPAEGQIIMISRAGRRAWR